MGSAFKSSLMSKFTHYLASTPRCASGPRAVHRCSLRQSTTFSHQRPPNDAQATIQQLRTFLKTSMRERNTLRTNVLKGLLSTIQYAQKEREGLSATAIHKIIRKAIRTREESVESYSKAGRHELAEGEKAEIGVLQEFLPRQMSDEEIRAVLVKLIADVNATSVRDLMKSAFTEGYLDQSLCDPKQVQEVAKRIIGV